MQGGDEEHIVQACFKIVDSGKLKKKRAEKKLELEATKDKLEAAPDKKYVEADAKLEEVATSKLKEAVAKAEEVERTAMAGDDKKAWGAYWKRHTVG